MGSFGRLRPCRARIGFTLIELLVVIGIVAVLIALILPAVMQAREAARRMQCSSNLKQLGIAFHNYEEVNRCFPPGARHAVAPGGSTSFGPSFLVSLLPFIEEHDLYDRLNNSGQSPGMSDELPTTSSGYLNGQEVAKRGEIALFRCPSSPGESRTAPFEHKSHYYGVSGAYRGDPLVRDDDFDEIRLDPTFTIICNYFTYTGHVSGGGILMPNRSIKIKEISDGTSSTLMLLEMSDRRYWILDRFAESNSILPYGWMMGTRVPGYPGPNEHDNCIGGPTSLFNKPSELTTCIWNLTTIRYRSNTRPLITSEVPYYAPPGAGADGFINNPASSYHARGVYSLAADGSVHFLDDSMNFVLLKRLATRDDGGDARF